MIEVEAVQPNAREYRPVRKGWGTIHWVCAIPANAILVGFIAFGLISTTQRDWYVPPGLFAALLLGSWLVSVAGTHWLRRVSVSELAKSPAGRLAWKWTIDRTGLRFETGLQSNSVEWRGVKSVLDEKDRFVFLVTPAYNPVLPKRLLTAKQLEELAALVSEVQTSGRLGAGVDSPPLPSDNQRP